MEYLGFSKKQIFFTSCVSGILPAAYLISGNFLAVNQRRGSFLVKGLGYFFSFLTYFLTVFLAEIFIVNAEVFHTNKMLGYGLVILLFLIIQSGLSFAFMAFGNKLCGNVLIQESNIKRKKMSLFYFLNYFLMGIAITSYLFIYGPFLFLFSAIYLLPNVYLYSHLSKMFNSQRAKLVFAIFFIILVLVFPISEFAIDNPNNFYLRMILLLGYYYTPILLYSVLLYLLFDLFQLINMKFKVLSENLINSRKIRGAVFSVLFLIVVIIMIKGIHNFNNTSIQKYSIEIPKKTGNLDQLKVAMAADIHFSEITNEYFARQFIEKINSINPDIVFFAGDIVESNRSNSKMDFFTDQLKKINSRYGVYAIEGNHELYGRPYNSDFFHSSDIILLRDSICTIANSIQIVGRKDRHDRNRKSLPELLEQNSDSLPNLLLNHQPYNLDIAYDNNVDIQLSGHTHYGQLFPINLIVDYIYEIAWGYRKINNTHFFVTCGAQGWGPQVKTASKSEIMEININFTN